MLKIKVRIEMEREIHKVEELEGKLCGSFACNFCSVLKATLPFSPGVGVDRATLMPATNTNLMLHEASRFPLAAQHKARPPLVWREHSSLVDISYGTSWGCRVCT